MLAGVVLLTLPTAGWVTMSDAGPAMLGIWVLLAIICALGLAALSCLPSLTRGDRP